MRTWFAVGLWIAVCASWGYWDDGHKAVGHLAEKHLAGTRAATEVRKILAPGETLADAAIWADEVKKRSFVDANAEAKTFVDRNPNHSSYHYVNLPLDAPGYRLGWPGTRPDTGPGVREDGGDIVQMTKACIAVLRGESNRFSKREALRLLAHFVGDMHQPLHVGCGYLTAGSDGKALLVGMLANGEHDMGGNRLILPSNQNLHLYWDGPAVERAMAGRTAQAYAMDLYRYARWQPASKGDPMSWPELWATEGQGLSRYAYAPVRLDPTNPAFRPGTTDRFKIQMDGGQEAYAQFAATTSRNQIAKAGYRLAEVLKSIWPD